MKELRVDGGSEFLGALRVWARRHGIEVGTSAPGQHQHNPYAERYWLGLLNKLRVVFLQSGAPAFLAGEFAIALNTIRNMLPTAKSLVYGRSPFELHTGKKPDVSKCLPLGSMVIVHDYDPSRGGVRRNKYVPRGRLGVYVGPCEIGARVYLFDTHCVTRRRLEDLHSEPDRWPFKERGYDPASGFLVELERHAAMLRDRISRSYLGEEEEQRRRAGLAEAGADEERKASAGELVGDSREEDDGEGTEVPEEPVADKRAKELAGDCGRAEEDAADKVPSSSNGPDRRGRRNSNGESGGEGEDLPDLDSEEESEVGSEEDAGGGFEELERFLPKGGGCRMLEDYSEPKAGARVLYRNPSGARGWLVGTLGRRTTDRERRLGWNWNVVLHWRKAGWHSASSGTPGQLWSWRRLGVFRGEVCIRESEAAESSGGGADRRVGRDSGVCGGAAVESAAAVG